MSEDWQAVADAIEQRMAELRRTQQEVAAKARISPVTLRRLQRGEAPIRSHRTTLVAVSTALEWPANHLQNVLAGTPRLAEEPSSDPVLTELLAIRSELQRINDRLDSLESHEA